MNGNGIVKLSIKSLDDGTQVTAQTNPKQLQVEKPVPWSKIVPANNSNDQGIYLAFSSPDGRTMTFELLFEGSDVAATVGTLEKLASVWKPASPNVDERRPHRCVAEWGTVVTDFRCVVTSLSITYTQFSDGGAPLSATCAVTLREADVVSVAH